MKARYHHLQKYLKRMWNCLVKEYQPDLNTQAKWHKEAKPLKIGDVVLIKETKHPRGKWPIALVEELRMSTDGLQRVATLRCNGKTLQRAFNQLAPNVSVTETEATSTETTPSTQNSSPSC